MSEGTQTQNPLNGLMGGVQSLQVLAFVARSGDTPITSYDGEIPADLRGNLYQVAQMAETFGFNADIDGDITQMLDQLTPAMLVDAIKGMDEEAFTAIYNDHPQIRDMITAIAQPFIAERAPTMTLREASTLMGMDVPWGDALGGITVGEISADSVEPIISEMENPEILALLNSLPEEQIAAIITELGQDDGEPIEGLDLSGMSLEDAITARAEHGEATAYLGLASLFNKEDVTNQSSINAVYDEIRASIPSELVAIVSAQDPGAMGELDAATVYGVMSDTLATDEGEISILSVLTQDRMAEIRAQLSAMEDHSFLVNLIPQDVQDVMMLEKMRQVMNDNGLLGPVANILASLGGFLIGIVESFGPRFLGEENTAKITETLQSFADPNATPQEVVVPDAVTADTEQDPSIGLPEGVIISPSVAVAPTS